MSKKIPFERTESSKNDNLHITVIGPTCQQDKLCPKETPGMETTVIAGILASMEGTKVYPHPVKRDGKGNITRENISRTKRKEGAEK